MRARSVTSRPTHSSSRCATAPDEHAVPPLLVDDATVGPLQHGLTVGDGLGVAAVVEMGPGGGERGVVDEAVEPAADGRPGGGADEAGPRVVAVGDDQVIDPIAVHAVVEGVEHLGVEAVLVAAAADLVGGDAQGRERDEGQPHCCDPLGRHGDHSK